MQNYINTNCLRPVQDTVTALRWQGNILWRKLKIRALAHFLMKSFSTKIRSSSADSPRDSVRQQEIREVHEIDGKPGVSPLFDRHVSVLGRTIHQLIFLWGDYVKKLHYEYLRSLKHIAVYSRNIFKGNTKAVYQNSFIMLGSRTGILLIMKPFSRKFDFKQRTCWKRNHSNASKPQKLLSRFGATSATTRTSTFGKQFPAGLKTKHPISR